MSKGLNFESLSITIEEKDDVTHFHFKGEIDESFKKENIPAPNTSRAIFHLENVSNLNSCGIREWIFLISELSKSAEIIYQDCSVTFIDQINMVPELKANGHITSFFAPYYCSNHGEVNKLINKDKMDEISQTLRAPIYKCDDCSADLEFDALEDSYFMFLNALPKAS